MSEAKTIILFRFHEDTEKTREQLRILHYFNPDVRIYALYGGKKADFTKASKKISDLVESTWFYSDKKPVSWKWCHQDVLVKKWYREVGYSLQFDFLYSYEYDIITLKPLSQIYPNIYENMIALSSPIKLTSKMLKKWWWTSSEAPKNEVKGYDFEGYMQYMKKTYGIKKKVYFCQGPGALFSKKFLQAWTDEPDMELVHEELIYTVFAQALGFKVVDNSMHPGFKKSDEETKYFNCEPNRQITHKMVIDQWSTPNGCRVFHPVKEKITLEDLGLK